MSWLPEEDGVDNERGVLELSGGDPGDIQVRAVIPKGVRWVDGKRRFDREDLLASARRERQRQHDAYERLRQFDLDHPEVWQTYFNPQYGADSETGNHRRNLNQGRTTWASRKWR